MLRVRSGATWRVKLLAKGFCTTGRWLCLYPRRQDCCRVTESQYRLRWVAGMFTGVWGLVLGREFLLAGAWPRL